MKFSASFFHCFNPLPIDAAEERGGEVGAIPDGKFRIFAYNELKSATHGFKNKIGEGGFGSVYKGRLIGATFVAVKILSVELESLRGEREFISEIAALSDIKHENLVTLRGCCIDGAQRFLVYDYMKNNSLTHTFLGSAQNREKFTWTLRKHVSLGIARGLCYLHEEVNPHIVHRDIKASNILLDENFTPKLADFGLAKLFMENMSYVSTRVAGTMGYISPEYAYSGHLTRKSDVYSFGVLLLQIVTGRQTVEYHFQHGEQFLVEKVWEMHNAGNLVELVDPALKGDFSQEEAIRFLKIGLLCVQETSKLRPAISTAMAMMNNEIDTGDAVISRPGYVADLMEVRIRQKDSSTSTASHATSSRKDSLISTASHATSSTGSFQGR